MILQLPTKCTTTYIELHKYLFFLVSDAQEENLSESLTILGPVTPRFMIALTTIKDTELGFCMIVQSGAYRS